MFQKIKKSVYSSACRVYHKIMLPTKDVDCLTKY